MMSLNISRPAAVASATALSGPSSLPAAPLPPGPVLSSAPRRDQARPSISACCVLGGSKAGWCPSRCCSGLVAMLEDAAEPLRSAPASIARRTPAAQRSCIMPCIAGAPIAAGQPGPAGNGNSVPGTLCPLCSSFSNATNSAARESSAPWWRSESSRAPCGMMDVIAAAAPGGRCRSTMDRNSWRGSGGRGAAHAAASTIDPNGCRGSSPCCTALSAWVWAGIRKPALASLSLPVCGESLRC